MKKVGRKKQFLIIAIILFICLILGGFLYFDKDFLKKADFFNSNQVAATLKISYTNSGGNELFITNSSEYSNIVSLTKFIVDPDARRTKLDQLSCTLVLKNDAGTDVNFATGLNSSGEMTPDWSVSNDIDPYKNRTIKITMTGFLPKILDNVNLENGGTIDAGTLYGGNANGDTTINVSDFALLLKWWNSTNQETDFNGDNTTDVSDFTVLLKNWGKQS